MGYLHLEFTSEEIKYLVQAVKLVPSGISGNNFAVLSHTWFHLTFWISSHFPAGASFSIGEFLDMLQKLLFVFSIRMFRFYGVLWSTLCRMSSRMTSSGN